MLAFSPTRPIDFASLRSLPLFHPNHEVEADVYWMQNYRTASIRTLFVPPVVGPLTLLEYHK